MGLREKGIKGVENFIEGFQPGTRFRNFLSQSTQDNTEPSIQATQQITTNLLQTDLDDTIPEQLFGEFENAPLLLKVLFALMSPILILKAALGGAFTPIERKISYAFDRFATSGRFDIFTMAQMSKRRKIDTNLLKQHWQDLGYDVELLTPFIESTQPRLNLSELIAAVNRGYIDEGFFNRHLSDEGHTGENIEVYNQLREVFPSVQDEVQFAVRGVFKDDEVERFDLFAEIDDDFIARTKRLGLSFENARNYWGAHWQLPGLNSVFSMFHRLRPGRSNTPFTSDDLQIYLRAADFPIFWRDRLTAISYNVIGRVDIRRFFRLGVFDENEVRNRFLDAGFSPRDADFQLQFAIAERNESLKSLTSSTVLSAFRIRMISEQQTRDLLTDIGVQQDELDFILQLENFKLSQEQLEQEISFIKEDFISGDIQESDARTRLASIGVISEQEDFLLSQWNRLKSNKVSRPTKAELERWFKRDIIDENEFRQGLSELGWNSERIGFFLLDTAIDLEIEANKEAERQRKENDRIQASEIANDEQREKSTIDVAIKDIELSIAELKLALITDEDEDNVTELKTQIEQLKVEKAQKRLEKAQTVLSFRE